VRGVISVIIDLGLSDHEVKYDVVLELDIYIFIDVGNNSAET